MRLPPAPPKFTEIAKGLVSSDKDTMISVFRNLSRHDVKQLLQIANDQYLHWHKFRYKPRPSDAPRRKKDSRRTGGDRRS